jgi:pimeloyl-ACP methyl ester carboxylesterase
VNSATHGPPATLTRLSAADGVVLRAAHLPPAAPAPLAFVVAHGFTGSARKPAVRQVTRALTWAGGVVAFDFRGHGGSSGRSTLGDLEVHDLAAAVGWARELGYTRVVTVGWSMGGAVAVRHAALHGGVDAVVSVSAPSRWYYRGTLPMRRLHWMVERPLGRLVSRYALRTRISAAGWDPVPAAPTELAARIAPVPLLVVHGDRDAYFPLEHAEALHAAAAEPKELWVEQGYGHAEAAADPDLVRRIAGWAAAACDVRADGS